MRLKFFAQIYKLVGFDPAITGQSDALSNCHWC